jgi:signal peptidase II
MNRFLTWLRSRLLPLSIMAAAVILDVVTKQLAIAHLKPIGSVPIIKNVFHLTYRVNYGAAWSIFSAPDQRWIFMTVSTVAILGLLAYLLIVKLDSRLMQLGLGAIIGGGIGNMIDRISLGYVVDFLDARIINFPVFNVADCFVCIGAGLLMLSLLLDWRKEAKGDKRENDAADH